MPSAILVNGETRTVEIDPRALHGRDRWWDHWLGEAQAWHDLDEDGYSHGVLAIPRREWPAVE